MPAIETLNSFVNTWECDENDHLNVQFYFAKIDEADRQFRFLTGLSDAVVGTRRVRHVRYHGELFAAALITVRSSVAFDGPHVLSVVHEMVDASSGRLAATVLDGYAPQPRTADALRKRFADVEAPMQELAAPRSFDAAAAATTAAADALLEAGAISVNRATVMPRDCTAEGRAEDRFLLGCFTDGAPHLWERTAMTRAWLEKNDYGRVAMEMKLSYGTVLKAGTPVHVVSGFTGVTRKTFSFRHHLFDSAAGRLAAVMDVSALVLDLEARKAVPLPDAARADITRLQLKP